MSSMKSFQQSVEGILITRFNTSQGLLRKVSSQRDESIQVDVPPFRRPIELLLRCPLVDN